MGEHSAGVRRARSEVESALEELASMWVEGTKFTFVARPPVEGQHMIITSDDLPTVASLLQEPTHDR